jgi:AIPR protein
MTPNEPSTNVEQKRQTRFAEGPGWAALSGRDDLRTYGDSSGLLLFVAQLRLGFDDVDTFATDALTDGGNDKKCDLVAVMRDTGRIVVAQSYVAQKPETKSEGPANKASDLNTAVSWLLSGELHKLPDVLRSAAEEARDALESGEISEFQIWSVHNLPEGKNIETELEQAAKTASSLIKSHFPDAQVNVTHTEIGRATVDEDYRRIQVPILVTEEIEFVVSGGFQTSGDSWTAYNTAIKASDLRALWQKHSTELMSPNIRDYLGVRKTERNINYGIKQTARESPANFIIYNNGITAMVHKFEATFSDDVHKIKITGMGIVNGGQTTGSIGTLSDDEAKRLGDALVQIRFVASKDAGILENVVRFNNTQNKVEATDFRSKDAVQDRLRIEFLKIPEALYRGGRRGGADDAIKRDRTVLPDGSVAQSLTAFHGFPNLAYNELRQIWEHDPTYGRFFNDNLHARHLVFCYSLLKAVEQAKLQITKIDEPQRTQAQKNHAEFFRSRGSAHLLTAAFGHSIETVLGHAIVNRFALQFVNNLTPTEATAFWYPVIQTGLAFSGQLKPATNLGLKSTEKVADALNNFSAMIEATRTANATIFDTFSAAVEPTSKAAARPQTGPA